ncbi:RNA polymerase sigma factor [Francisellaceae bacterium]|nr:RNA polymerase sigma factor [Francisellaceae bacterium]
MERDLVNDILNNDALAKRKLIQLHHQTLKKVILQYAGEKDHEDILQEAWIKIFTNLHKFAFKSKLQSWMIRIAINTANTHHRKKSNSTEDDFACFEESTFKEDGHWQEVIQNWQASPEQDHQANKLQEIINQELCCLPAAQKSVLLLHDSQGFSFQEICNILDISSSNVRVLLHRARQQLMLKVDQYYGTK